MIRAIIVEDQPPAQRILQKYAEDIGTIEIIGTFADAIQAVHFLGQESVDLMFLDIHLPKMSGIDLLKTQGHKLPQVILTTAFADYALESYEYQVVDYLLKPFSFARFVKAIQNVTTAELPSSHLPQRNSEQHPTYLMIKSGYDLIKVEVDDIYYIQSDSDYTEIHTTKQRLVTHYTLKHWQETLPPDAFCRIHKSIIIQLSHLSKVTGSTAYLGDQQLSIGRAYKEDFLKRVSG